MSAKKSIKKPRLKTPRLTPRMKEYYALQIRVNALLDTMDEIWFKMPESERVRLNSR